MNNEEAMSSKKTDPNDREPSRFPKGGEIMRQLHEAGLIIADEDFMLAFEERLGQAGEEDFWKEIIGNYSGPLPDGVVVSLMERKLCLSELGHSIQSIKMMWMLADISSEARISLGKILFLDPKSELGSVKRFLDNHHNDPWLLQSLARIEPSSHELELLLKEYLLKAPSGDELIKTFESYSAARRVVSEDNPDILRDLFLQFPHPKVFLNLAKNLMTPLDILNSLSAIKDVKLAKQIRNNAKETIRKRG